MNIRSLVKNILDYTKHIKGFSKNAKLLLLSQGILSLAFGIFFIFFNVYLKKGGLTEDIIGSLSSIGTFSMVAFAIPTGILVSKLGGKKSLLISIPLFVLASALSSITLVPFILIALSIISALGNMVFSAAYNPSLMASSTDEDRHYLFSLSFALMNLTGVVGSIAGGVFPDILSNIFNVSEFFSLRITLFLSAIIGMTGFFPLMLIEDKKIRTNDEKIKIDWKDKEDLKTFSKFSILNFVIGLGAGFSIPFLSLYFATRFSLKPTYIGLIFSVSSAITGFAVLSAPLLVKRFGKLMALIIPQGISIPLLIILAHSRLALLSVFAFWVRGALMNASNPVMNQIIMEETKEEKRPIINNVTVLFWNTGWAISVAVSGVIIKNQGYTLPFYLTFIAYIIYISLLYIFFKDDKALRRRENFKLEEKEEEKVEALIAE